jgi:hypothetical protein
MSNFTTTLPMDEIAKFCQRWKIRELALFGSALRDDFGPDSDGKVAKWLQPTAYRPARAVGGWGWQSPGYATTRRCIRRRTSRGPLGGLAEDWIRVVTCRGRNRTGYRENVRYNGNLHQSETP